MALSNSFPTFLEQRFVGAAKGRTLSEAEELTLATRWVTKRDRKAATALVEAHIPVVIQIARRLRGYGVSQEDLVAEGCVGLMRAVDKFDGRGVRFKTYATYWIRAFMLAYVQRAPTMVTEGTGALGQTFFFRLRSARARAEALLGPDVEGVTALLARQFDVSEDVISHQLARLGRRDVSLDAPAEADGEASVGDLMPSAGTNAEDALHRGQANQLVHAAMRRVWSGLDRREQMLVSERLMADEPRTLAQLASEFGLSRERLRQLEKRLKQRLARVLHATLEAEAVCP